LPIAAVVVPLVLPVATGAVDAAGYQARIDSLRCGARYSEARDVAEELLATLREELGASHWQVQDAERLVATLHRIASLPPDTRAELAEADRGETDIETAAAEGRFEDALHVARRNLEIRQQHLGEKDAEVAATLAAISACQFYLDDQEGALASSENALRIRSEVLGDDHPVLGTHLNELALLKHQVGRHDGDIEQSLLGLEIVRKAPGYDSEWIAVSLNNVADIVSGHGQKARGEQLYREARRLLQDRDEFLNRYYFLTITQNLGALLAERGENVGAMKYLDEALSLGSSLLGEEHPMIATVRANRATLLPPVMAIDELRWSVAYYERHGASQVKPLRLLGGAQKSSGRLAEADSTWQRRREVAQSLYGPRHPETARALEDLGWLSLDLDRLPQAESSFREALQIRSESSGWSAVDLEMSQTGLGRCLRRLGRYAEAESVLTEAGATFDRNRARRDRPWRLENPYATPPFDDLAATRLARAGWKDAWIAAETGRGIILADLMFVSHRRPLTPNEIAREDSLRQALSVLDAQYEELLAQPDSQMSAAAEDARDRLITLEQEWAEFQKTLVSRYAESAGTSVDLAEVQAGLVEDTAVIGWLDPQGATPWGWVLRARGDVHWVALDVRVDKGPTWGPAPLLLREEVSQVPVPVVSSTLRWAESAWRERFQPLETLLEGVEHLVVVPSGGMLGVPVEALLDERGKFVGERFVVSYAPSATSYVQLAQRDALATEGPALLVGDAMYQADPALEHGAEVRCAARSIEPGLREGVRSGNEEALKALRALPGTKEEIAAIRGVRPGADVLLGLNASEQRVAELLSLPGPAPYSLLHFAVHGFSDDQRPWNSALILSQVGLPEALQAAIRGERIFDGRITAQEILGDWNLDAELVVLSACETGLGQITGDGYLGLMHAFFQAGARSVIVSLWPVEDCATSLLMTRFYEAYAGRDQMLTKARALSAAKRQLRGHVDAAGHRPYEHPYFWAGFVLFGDDT
jgi:CHAT domain-containing protein/tetratricopeptide (TPR) repeat protein